MALVLWLLWLLVAPYAWAQIAEYHQVDTLRPINWGAPLNRGLLAWYMELPQINQAGVLWRSLTGKYDGTLAGMAAPLTSLASGRGRTIRTGGVGQLNMDGTNDYVDLTNTPVLDFVDADATLSLWFKSTSATLQYLLSKRNGGNAAGYLLRINADGTLTASLRTVSSQEAATRISVSTTNANGAWHQAVMAFHTDSVVAGNSTMVLWIDGKLDQGALTNSAGETYSGPSSVSLRVGSNNNDTAFLTGAVDNVQLYTRIFTDAEVVQRYLEDRLGNPTTLFRPEFALATVVLTSFQGNFFQLLR